VTKQAVAEAAKTHPIDVVLKDVKASAAAAKQSIWTAMLFGSWEENTGMFHVVFYDCAVKAAQGEKSMLR
jgi:hypothetical protein